MALTIVVLAPGKLSELTVDAEVGVLLGAVVLVVFGMPRITSQGTLRSEAPLLTFVTVTVPLLPICTGSKVEPGPIWSVEGSRRGVA